MAIKALKVITPMSVLVVLIMSFIAVLQTSALSSSQPVELQVPATTITISGQASPSALVTITENNVTIGTTTANALGQFSKTITSSTGLKNIQVFYKDSNNRQSTKISQSLSVTPQNDTKYSVFLSPTIELGTQPIVRRGSVVQIRGYSLPNAEITATLDYGSTTLKTQTNNNGFYEYFINTNSMLEGAHTVYTTARKGSLVSKNSAVISFNIQTEEQGFVPDIIVSPQKIPPPTVTTPDDGAIIDGSNITIYGESRPYAQINVYDDKVLISTVTSDSTGKWEFYYIAYKTPVKLVFEACLGDECSILSAPLNLEFTSPIILCSENTFDLVEYRFWDVSVGSEITVEFKEVPNGVIELDKGYDDPEQFTINATSSKLIYLSYPTSGVYNGSIALKNNSCETVRYFSAIVVNKEDENNLYYIIFLVVILLFGSYLAYKDRISQEKNRT